MDFNFVNIKIKYPNMSMYKYNNIYIIETNNNTLFVRNYMKQRWYKP